jgi:hypothetical protein
MDASTAFDGSSTVGSAPGFGRANGPACNTWTSSSSGTPGTYLAQEGGVSNNGACNVLRPLACCNGAPKTTFVGVTSAPATMTGRVAMHVACNAQFVGSHMCHAAEYLRAHSALPIPASGAWLDASTSQIGGTTSGGAAIFGRANGPACNTWTSTSSGTPGTYVAQEGGISNNGACNVLRPVACCL